MSGTPASNQNLNADLQHVDIRPLTAADTLDYRALRDKIRQGHDSRFFSDSYTREDQLTDSQWLEWCTEKPEHGILGTFVNHELVGIVMITQYGPAEDRTAEWEASWLDPRFRGTGVTPAAYEKVREWTEEQGYTHVKVFIREDNTHWLDVRKKQGFVQTGSQNVAWADGSTGNMHIFALDLQALSLAHRRDQTVRHLEETMTVLNDGPHVVPEQQGLQIGPMRPGLSGATPGQKRFG